MIYHHQWIINKSFLPNLMHLGDMISASSGMYTTHIGIITPIFSCWNENSWACINSLNPGRLEWSFICVILVTFKLIFATDGGGISCEIALVGWLSLDLNWATLIQVMVWLSKTTSHYQNHWWQSPPMPNGSKWFKIGNLDVSKVG